MTERPLLAALEEHGAAGGELRAPLAFLAARAVALDPDRVRGAVRRALFVLAAGGDPARELAADDRAVVSLADDLDAPAHRGELSAALRTLLPDAAGLPHVETAVRSLLADDEAAWRWLALSLLADELGGEGDG